MIEKLISQICFPAKISIDINVPTTKLIIQTNELLVTILGNKPQFLAIITFLCQLYMYKQ